MRIAGIQTDIAWEAPEENFRRLAPKIAAAAADGARLVLLPEMFATGFSMATDEVAELEGGRTEQFLRDQAMQHGIHVGGSCAVAATRHARPCNRFILAGPDDRIDFYDKIHPFSYGEESEFYTAGTRAVTIEIEGLRCSLFVCYDLRFADSFWALAQDTDAYLVVANWPAARAEHWSVLLRARAIENLAYVVGVNRVGEGGGIGYAGGSCVVDPFGKTVSEAADRESVVMVDVDPGRVAEVRSRYPFLDDR